MIDLGNEVKVGGGNPPVVVAELSGNHNGSLEQALRIVEAVAEAGAQAVKIQTYTADTMTLDVASDLFRIADPNSLWSGRTLHDLYEEAHTPWAWHQPIFDRARQLGLLCFSTPFDASSVEFLESIGATAYKVSSFENTDHPLLRAVAATGKPVIMSTGASRLWEVCQAVEVLRDAGCDELVVLKCTSTYPALPSESNIATIPHLRQMLGCEVGLSDHTLGIGVALGAVALGASLIEKHVTLDRSAGGVDSKFSLEPSELQLLVEESQRVHQAVGTVSYGLIGGEKKSVNFKRSIFVSQDVAKGEPLTSQNIRVVRPNGGLAPRYYSTVIGARAAVALTAGTPLAWDHLLQN